MKINVLFAHQSAEMYGSDKVLLYMLDGLASADIVPIVLLPERGPLLNELEALGFEVHVVPLAKISRKSLSFLGLLYLPLELIQSIKSINRIIAGRNIHVVYSNTVAILAAAVWSYIWRIPHVWHVHEILLHPSLVRRGFPFLIRLFANKVICNSRMTLEWIVAEQPILKSRSLVIWNGQGPRPSVNHSKLNYHKAYFNLPHDSVVCALVGRVSRWKGQDVLIDAATLLWQRGIRNVLFLIVGGAVLNEAGERCLSDMKSRMASSPACSNIRWLDYTNDVWSIWDFASIAIVPSTEPEPFGMVAIEAMASSRPVIASAHGGLVEIVDDGITGVLVKPCSAASLADAIEKLIYNPEARVCMGEAGRLRQLALFSLDKQISETLKVLRDLSYSKGL